MNDVNSNHFWIMLFVAHASRQVVMHFAYWMQAEQTRMKQTDWKDLFSLANPTLTPLENLVFVLYVTTHSLLGSFPSWGGCPPCRRARVKPPR